MEDKGTIGIIVTHGNLAGELLATAESILGPIDCVHTLSNKGLSNQALIDMIREIADSYSDRFVIVFVDYFGGSCCRNCVTAVKGNSRAKVVSGVNLPILLDFVTKQGTMGPEEMINNLIRRGRESVKVIDL